MTLTFNEWEVEIQKMSKDQATKYHEALEVLRSWKTFDRAFSSTGLFIVSTLLDMRAREK